jgi:5'-3' exoribonuclease 2
MGRKCSGKVSPFLSNFLLTLGVALLPFIDEARLLSAMEPLWDELSEEELIRNGMGSDILFVGQQNKLYDSLGETFYAMNDGIEVLPNVYT